MASDPLQEQDAVAGARELAELRRRPVYLATPDCRIVQVTAIEDALRLAREWQEYSATLLDALLAAQLDLARALADRPEVFEALTREA